METISETLLQKIRENERISHMEMYRTQPLYGNQGWLKKPVKTVMDAAEFLVNRQQLNILDLGCGVGRNSIALAQKFAGTHVQIDCVDILEFAIAKLQENAIIHGVSQSIRRKICSIDEFTIPADFYDMIIAVSALEHMDSLSSFKKKLQQIRDGVRESGVICFVINSEIKEYQKGENIPVTPQFEINLSTDKLCSILEDIFQGWKKLKYSVVPQAYDVPRDFGISLLKTNVVTFAAQKIMGGEP